MNRYPEIKKVFTENSLIDEIIYECKQILKGIIVKDDEEANYKETLQSLQDADLYHDIIMGTDQFKNFEYTYDIFMKIPSMTPDRAIRYAKEQLPIPDGLKPELQRIAREKWMANYDEKNEYYRKIWGKPPRGDEYIYLTEEEYLMIPVESYDISKPVHECTASEAELLYTSGVIDSLKSKYPNASYLDHLGDRAVHPYTARRAPKFSLLYIPPVDSYEVSSKWRERYEINRVFALKTIYTDAMHYKSPYYDKFIIMLIIIMTFDDLIVYSPEFIIDRDLFDFRTIQYLFEACGVRFFPEIPLKYQKRLIKNLNRLIKYKSSPKCMVDIISLFGYDNMKVHKYYLTKSPIMNDDGTYKKDTYTDPKTQKEIEDIDANYKLRFLKVPIGEIADDYILDESNYVSYEETAEADIYWQGIYTEDYVKHTILEHDFDLHISKYISLDTVYSMAEMQFQMVYFMNMVLYSDINTDSLLVDVYELSTSIQFKITDLMITLFALGYMYQGCKDNIIYDPVQTLAVYGFNFKTDLDKLKQYVSDNGESLSDIKLDKFIMPESSRIRTFEELDKIYTDNKECYDRLVWLMNNANNKNEYDVYRKVYESLYVTRLSFNMFKEKGSAGYPPKTYTDYIMNSNAILYSAIIQCGNITNDKERSVEITRLINVIVDSIYTYIDQDKFRYVFNGIPTVGLDYIIKYARMVIDFFKSYKVDVIHTNITYIFDDRMHNKIRVIDKILFGYLLSYEDKIHVSDCFKLLTTLEPEDKIEVVDILQAEVTYWKERRFIDDIRIKDKFKVFISYIWKDIIQISDNANISHDYYWSEHIPVLDDTNLTILSKYKSHLGVMDEGFYMDITHGPIELDD